MAEVSEAIVEAVFGGNADLIRAYVGRLAGAGVERGVIGPAEKDRLWERHIFNSAALAGLIDEGAALFDVGSGAGLPGVPLALARPDLTVTLIEPLLRRSLFLEEVLVELDLSDRVQVVRKRGEEVRERADVVVARAVAPLDRLVAATAHLFAGGRLFALKGEKAAAELAAAAGELQARGLEATLLWAQAHPQTTAARVVRVAEAGQVAPTEPAEEI